MGAHHPQLPNNYTRGTKRGNGVSDGTGISGTRFDAQQSRMLFPELDNSPSKERKRALLCALVLTGGLYRACENVGINRKLHYIWLKYDQAYVDAFKQAMSWAGDVLEAAAFQRGVEGVDEPVYYQGEACGYVKRYSDTLLKTLLKAAKPEKYAERADITSAGSALRIVIDDGSESPILDGVADELGTED